MDHDDRETFTVYAMKRPWHDLTGDYDTAVQAAADTAKEAIALLLGQLADRVLGRPEHVSDEWLAQARRERDDPELKRARAREWHLTKMAIERALGLDHTGNAINARRNGASWQSIADACGITRQAAHDRWAKYEDLTSEKGER